MKPAGPARPERAGEVRLNMRRFARPRKSSRRGCVDGQGWGCSDWLGKAEDWLRKTSPPLNAGLCERLWGAGFGLAKAR
jgi:hypothetical protein